MKKSIVIAIIVILITSITLVPGVQADDGGLKVLNDPFSVDMTGLSSLGQQIPTGSIIHHQTNGKTIVTGPNGKVVFTTDKSHTGLVTTPNGFRDASRVYNVPSDSFIDSENGVTRIYNKGEIILQIIDDVVPKRENSLILPTYSDWIESSDDWSVSNLDYFTGYWTVPTDPPAPEINDVNFLFTGIEPSDGSAIIQPVLEWNQAGSGGWTCSAWVVWDGGSTRATPKSASAGDVLLGAMAYTGSQWYVALSNNSTSQTSSLYTNRIGTSNLAVFCALEGYNVDDGDVPGDTTFDYMSLKYNTNTVDIDWVSNVRTGTGLSGLFVQIYSDSKVKLYTDY